MKKIVLSMLVIFNCVSCDFVEGMLCRRNFTYESMIGYREEGRDLLYGRKGVTDLTSALIREERFLAGNKSILQEINELEEAVEKDKCCSVHLMELSIRNIISKIKGSLTHVDENGEPKSFDLNDKIDAITEIIIAYKNLYPKSQGYSEFQYTISFWEQFKELFTSELKKR